MKNTNAHWTDDAGLLADFVLDRMEFSTREKLKVHLRECDNCRKAVEHERTLVAGVKLLGREEMKKRLQGRVSVPHSRRIPWPHVLSAAAVLVIVAGIGVFNRWFVAHEDVVVQESQMAEGKPVPLESKLPVDSQKYRDEDPGLFAAKALPRSKAFTPPVRKKELTLSEARPEVASAERQDTDRLEDMKLSDRAREVIKERDLARKNVLPSEAEFSVQSNESGARPTASAEQSGAESEQTGATPEQATWVQGTIIEQRENSGINLEGEVRSLAKSPHMGMEKKDQRQAFRIQQRPFAALPLSQRQFQQTNTVQALVERTGTGEVQVTLFLDSLFNEVQLSKAVVQQVSDDSILVLVGGQIIGYRVPFGVYQAAPMK
ncbi:MAG: hypothetical protein ACKVRP_13920 [Bacteroidota bacterium]